MSVVGAGNMQAVSSITIAVSCGKVEYSEIEMPIDTTKFNSYKSKAIKKILAAKKSPSVGSFNSKKFGEWIDSL